MAKNEVVAENEYPAIMEETSKVMNKVKAFAAAVNLFSAEMAQIRTEVMRAESFLNKSLAESIQAQADAKSAREMAQTHLDSTSNGHRAMVDGITKERLEIQTLKSAIEKERREVAETRRLLDEQLRLANSKVRGLTNLETAGKK